MAIRSTGCRSKFVYSLYSFGFRVGDFLASRVSNLIVSGDIVISDRYSLRLDFCGLCWGCVSCNWVRLNGFAF